MGDDESLPTCICYTQQQERQADKDCSQQEIITGFFQHSLRCYREYGVIVIG